MLHFDMVRYVGEENRRLYDTTVPCHGTDTRDRPTTNSMYLVSTGENEDQYMAA